jgi:hypothetical protein
MTGGSRSPASEQVVAHRHLVLLDHAIGGHGCCLSGRYLPGLPGNALRRQPAITDVLDLGARWLLASNE